MNLIIELQLNEIESGLIKTTKRGVGIEITGARSLKPREKVATELVDQWIHGGVGYR